jgi:phenylalanyl-tRNA synthetase beta subunit
VEEVAREFQLDEIEPTLPAVVSNGNKPAIDAQALLQNLDELLSRLREANIMPVALRERKP